MRHDEAREIMLFYNRCRLGRFDGGRIVDLINRLQQTDYVVKRCAGKIDQLLINNPQAPPASMPPNRRMSAGPAPNRLHVQPCARSCFISSSFCTTRICLRVRFSSPDKVCQNLIAEANREARCFH